MPGPSPCLCETLRRASRIVTRMYDDALRPVELRTTQFSLLSELAVNGEARVQQLAAGLQVDETTLPRLVKPLEKRGLVAVRPGADRRQKIISITPAGRRVHSRAAPLWTGVQKELERRVRPTDWETAFRLLPRIAAGAE